MQTKTKCAVGLLLITVTVVILWGRSDQKRLVHRLGEADRVVVTVPGKPVGMTISNEQVKGIVQALKAAQKIPADVDAMLELTLDFFKGTNRLSSVPTSHRIFWIGKTPYEDKSGTLPALYEKSSL